MAKTTKEILVKARELINKGFHKGSYGVVNGVDVGSTARSIERLLETPETAECSVCLEAALHYAAGRHLRRGDEAWGLTKASLPDGWLSWLSLHSFNDHPGTTKEDVLAVLDRAISSCDVKEI